VTPNSQNPDSSEGEGERSFSNMLQKYLEAQAAVYKEMVVAELKSSPNYWARRTTFDHFCGFGK